MLHNPEAFNAEVLAGDIKRYRSKGVSLDEIHQGAMSNGIPDTMWQEAVHLYDLEQKIAFEKQRQKTRRTQKIIGFFVTMILVGGFFTFLIFQNIDTLQTRITLSTAPTTDDNQPQPLSESTPKIEPSIPTEDLAPTDTRFNEQVSSGNLVLDFFGTGKNKRLFRSVTEADPFLKQQIGRYHIQSVKIAFDVDGNPILNHFLLQNENNTPYFLLSNTLSPFQFQNATTVFHHDKTTNTPQAETRSDINDWQMFLEKIDYQNQSKNNLTFSAELFVKDEIPHFRVLYDYPDNTKDARLEVDFMRFTKGNGQESIAFGRDPMVSTGFLSQKYPIKRGPTPKASD